MKCTQHPTDPLIHFVIFGSHLFVPISLPKCSDTWNVGKLGSAILSTIFEQNKYFNAPLRLKGSVWKRKLKQIYTKSFHGDFEALQIWQLKIPKGPHDDFLRKFKIYPLTLIFGIWGFYSRNTHMALKYCTHEAIHVGCEYVNIDLR